MLINVTTRDENGNIAFNGTLSSREISYVLNIGINYLLANGAMPLFTGKEDVDLAVVAPAPEQVQ